MELLEESSSGNERDAKLVEPNEVFPTPPICSRARARKSVRTLTIFAPGAPVMKECRVVVDAAAVSVVDGGVDGGRSSSSGSPVSEHKEGVGSVIIERPSSAWRATDRFDCDCELTVWLCIWLCWEEPGVIRSSELCVLIVDARPAAGPRFRRFEGNSTHKVRDTDTAS